MSEIQTQTFGFQTLFSFWNPNFLSHLDFLKCSFQTEKSVWNVNVFVWISDTVRNPNCLEMGRKELSEIQTSRYHCISLSRYSKCLKFELVWISDTQKLFVSGMGTIIRKKQFGFQTSSDFSSRDFRYVHTVVQRCVN